MRIAAAVCVPLLAACSFHAAATGTAGDGGPDTRSIDAPDASGPCLGWHAYYFDACAIPSPSAAIAISDVAAFSTDTGTFTAGAVAGNPAPASIVIDQGGGVMARVVSIDSLTVSTGASLRVVGAMPLVIASWSTIQIDGRVDAASVAGSAGAGAGTGACANAGAGADEVDNGGGSGGGGGGALQGGGGVGGPGDMTAMNGPQNAGGLGGAGTATAPTIVRGGCPGAASGKAGPDAQVMAPSDATTTAPGGVGGGGLVFAARNHITLGAASVITTSGAGGGGAPLHSAVGGGGGGSGGLVAFDAAGDASKLMFPANARVAANGGGGGGSNGFAAVGQVGANGRDDLQQTLGGIASACSFAGGRGGALASSAGEGASQTAASCGGGGGGGGVGFIVVIGAAQTFASKLSPLPVFLAPRP